MSQIIDQALSQLENALNGLEKAAKTLQAKPKPAKSTTTDLFGMPLKAQRGGTSTAAPAIDPSFMARKLDNAIMQVDRILKDEAF